jgi:hypothetical protein
MLYANRASWRTRLRWLHALGPDGSFEQALAVLLSPYLKRQGIDAVRAAWKLSNAESKNIEWIDRNLLTLSRAHQLPWSQIQPLLIQPMARPTLQVGLIQFGADHKGINLCRDRLSQWPPEQLDPPQLLNGNDLAQLGIPSGPIYSEILRAVRREQLDQQIRDHDQAIAFASKYK